MRPGYTRYTSGTLCVYGLTDARAINNNCVCGGASGFHFFGGMPFGVMQGTEGPPMMMQAPGVCVFVCVCVCVCVFVCPHVLGRCNDALFHRCIRRFTDSSDASIHSSIHQCIKRVRCCSVVILFRYFSICCAVAVLISGLFLVSFCQSRGPF